MLSPIIYSDMNTATASSNILPLSSLSTKNEFVCMSELYQQVKKKKSPASGSFEPHSENI